MAEVLFPIELRGKEFSGASGLITFNFTLSDDGDVVDNLYIRLYTK